MSKLHFNLFNCRISGVLHGTSVTIFLRNQVFLWNQGNVCDLIVSGSSSVGIESRTPVSMTLRPSRFILNINPPQHFNLIINNFYTQQQRLLTTLMAAARGPLLKRVVFNRFSSVGAHCHPDTVAADVARLQKQNHPFWQVQKKFKLRITLV